jgi:hypothetical protein
MTELINGSKVGAAEKPAVPRPRRERQIRPSSISRWLRVLAGVHEPTLALGPTEEPRYTSLGGVVLGTASIATFAMWIGLNEVFGTVSVGHLLPALIWGLYILNFDRWLVSSSSGVRWGRRIGLLGGRLVLAAFFGVIVAEPLVLRVFETAVEQHVLDARASGVQDLASAYVRCNPVPGTPGSAEAAGLPDCGQYRLNIPFDPGGVSTRLASAQSQETGLAGKVERETADQKKLTDDANNECGGASGAGYTGRRGYGRQCLDRQQTAKDYADSHPIAEEQKQLGNLRGQIKDLQGQLGTQQDQFIAKRTETIDQETADMRSHQQEIGIAERFTALDELASANGFIWDARLFLSIFFVLVDCLPVLGKMLGGITVYDQLISRRESQALQDFDAELEARREESRIKRGMDQIERDAEAEKEKDEKVEELSDELLKKMRSKRRETGGENLRDELPEVVE